MVQEDSLAQGVGQSFFLDPALATSSVPQATPTQPLLCVCEGGALPIRATCSAFFTSCSARVLKRLDVYLYILNGWEKQPEGLSSRGQGSHWSSSGNTLPSCLLPSCAVLAPCDESKPSLCQQKDSIPYPTCPLPPAPALISNLTIHQVGH